MLARTQDDGVTRCVTRHSRVSGVRKSSVFFSITRLLILLTFKTRLLYTSSETTIGFLEPTALVCEESRTRKGRPCCYCARISRSPLASLVLWFPNQQNKLFASFLVFFKKSGLVESVNIETKTWRKWIGDVINISWDWNKFRQISFQNAFTAEFSIDPKNILRVFSSILAFCFMFCLWLFFSTQTVATSGFIFSGQLHTSDAISPANKTQNVQLKANGSQSHFAKKTFLYLFLLLLRAFFQRVSFKNIIRPKKGPQERC